MEKNNSFESAAIKDTFEDLYATIQPLIAEKKYPEARQEVKKELRLLAGALGGPIHERLATVTEAFEAFLPEDVRMSLETETAESPEAEGETATADNKSDEEIIAYMANEGWKLLRVVADPNEQAADDVLENGKFTITREGRKFIFERDKR